MDLEKNSALKAKIENTEVIRKFIKKNKETWRIYTTCLDVESVTIEQQPLIHSYTPPPCPPRSLSWNLMY